MIAIEFSNLRRSHQPPVYGEITILIITKEARHE